MLHLFLPYSWFRLLLHSSFVICLSLNSGESGVEGSLKFSTQRRTICAARPFTKFVSGSSPTPRHIRDDGRPAKRVSTDHRLQQHLILNPLKEVHLRDFHPKTSLRGIGLCNGHDTNFPYKRASSTYSPRPAILAVFISDEAVVVPLQLGGR
jgi:hypothetical protein